ncbi:hypothetical protein BpHYR1_040761 [Brachionus plicatilis]|uniref:Uncharacterized protein n=1 Tax=Brachionus plicatilis TaxID=10195 RepID=A0A3M7PRK4_BRAPC|nr:hypothetical protein BpHYR1_040761 [Brachionus plicatilis]
MADHMRRNYDVNEPTGQVFLLFGKGYFHERLLVILEADSLQMSKTSSPKSSRATAFRATKPLRNMLLYKLSELVAATGSSANSPV